MSWLGASNRSISSAVSGGGGGGALTDFSWTANVSGKYKSAQTGYIGQTYFSDSTGKYINRVHYMTSPGPVDVYFRRMRGGTNSCSVTATVSAYFNTTDGVNFNSVVQAVTFADGVTGEQRVSINVLAIPASQGIIKITLTGAKFRTYAYILLDGGGRYAGAKYLKSKGSSFNAFGDTSGNGSLATPWASLQYAHGQMPSGGLCYLQNTGGSFKEIVTGVDKTGAGNLTYAGSDTAPLIFMNDPQNVGIPVWDNGATATVSDAGAGIIFNSGASHIWFCTLKILHGNFNFQNATGTRPSHIVLWNHEVSDHRLDESNVGAVRADNTLELIVDNSYLHHIYSAEGAGAVGNDYDSVTAGYHEGVIAFNPNGLSVVGCTFTNLEFGVMEKNPSQDGGMGTEIAGGLFKIFQRSKSTTGNPMTFQVAGGGVQPFHDGVVRHCVHEGNLETATKKSGEMIAANPDSAVSTSHGLDIFNCVSRHNEGLAAIGNIDQARVFNNIIEDASNANLRMTGPNGSLTTSLELSDGNYVVRGSGNWQTASLYNFSAWKAISGDSRVANAPDAFSSVTGSTPGYANAAAFDYRNSDFIGIWGQVAGVGDFKVGRRSIIW